MVTSETYFIEREKLLKDLNYIKEKEYGVTQILLNHILPIANNLYADFVTRPLSLLPFWKNYPPEQRGRQPMGTSIPWLELGEKTISSNIIASLALSYPEIIFPGLPTGGDIRFAFEDVYVHLDIKLTGPNDNPDEVVVPPNQVSGDGLLWDNGVINSNFPVYYQTGLKKNSINYHFQPKLPPFYILENRTLICLTYFLEAIYGVDGFGNHPLQHFELSCVPNGLLMFDGPKYAETKGLIIAGKDDNTKNEDTKRIRIRLVPLGTIANWRSIIIYKDGDDWKTRNRISDNC